MNNWGSERWNDLLVTSRAVKWEKLRKCSIMCRWWEVNVLCQAQRGHSTPLSFEGGCEGGQCRPQTEGLVSLAQDCWQLQVPFPSSWGCPWRERDSRWMPWGAGGPMSTTQSSFIISACSKNSSKGQVWLGPPFLRTPDDAFLRTADDAFLTQYPYVISVTAPCCTYKPGEVLFPYLVPALSYWPCLSNSPPLLTPLGKLLLILRDTQNHLLPGAVHNSPSLNGNSVYSSLVHGLYFYFYNQYSCNVCHNNLEVPKR